MLNPTARRFDLIAFDWDGTLFDSTAIITRCIQEAVRDVGGQVPSAERASYVIGMALIPALAHAAPDVPPERYKDLSARYRYHYTQHMHDISLFEGVLDMLHALKAKGAMLTVATGNPLMLHELMAACGVGPERTVMIGDTTHDLEMAHLAGCASVGVSYGAHDHDEFERWKPLTVAHSVRELHDWLVTNG